MEAGVNIIKWKNDFIKKNGCKPTIYLSGPMTGYTNFNFEEFDRARVYFTDLGFEVISPADLDRQAEFVPEGGDPDKKVMKEIITRDMAGVLDADGVAFLDGYEGSKGATAEYALAYWYGIPTFKKDGQQWVSFCTSSSDMWNPVVTTVYSWKDVDWTATCHGQEETFPSQCCKVSTDDGGDESSGCCGDPLGCSKFAKNECCVHSRKKLPEENDILSEAKKLVCGDRNNQYGPPTQDFERIAAMWSTLFGVKFDSHQVACAMICLKLSRICWSPSKRDHWVDMAGYSQCGWWCAEDCNGKEKEEACS